MRWQIARGVGRFSWPRPVGQGVGGLTGVAVDYWLWTQLLCCLQRGLSKGEAESGRVHLPAQLGNWADSIHQLRQSQQSTKRIPSHGIFLHLFPCMSFSPSLAFCGGLWMVSVANFTCRELFRMFPNFSKFVKLFLDFGKEKIFVLIPIHHPRPWNRDPKPGIYSVMLLVIYRMTCDCIQTPRTKKVQFWHMRWKINSLQSNNFGVFGTV